MRGKLYQLISLNGRIRDELLCTHFEGNFEMSILLTEDVNLNDT